MAHPTSNELRYHVDEIGYSLISMCKHLLLSRDFDQKGNVDAAQATFDGSVMHVRAIVEFLGRTGSHIHATHYCAGWDGFSTAKARNFDLKGLYNELNMHAAHLSRLRYKVTPGPAYDLVPRIEGLLELFGDLLACPGLTLQQELGDQYTEARIQLARVLKY